MTERQEGAIHPPRRTLSQRIDRNRGRGPCLIDRLRSTLGGHRPGQIFGHPADARRPKSDLSAIACLRWGPPTPRDAGKFLRWRANPFASLRHSSYRHGRVHLPRVAPSKFDSRFPSASLPRRRPTSHAHLLSNSCWTTCDQRPLKSFCDLQLFPALPNHMVSGFNFINRGGEGKNTRTERRQS